MYFIFWVFVCSLMYPVCKTHVLYFYIWPVRFNSIFPHYLINSSIFRKKLLSIKRVSWFSLQILPEYNISLQPGHCSSLTAPNFQHTAIQERNDQCGNQYYSRELLMMGIVVPETCWAYKKYNKIISNNCLVFILQLSQQCTVQQTSKSAWNIPLSKKNSARYDYECM